MKLVHPGRLAVPVGLVDDAALPGPLRSEPAHLLESGPQTRLQGPQQVQRGQPTRRRPAALRRAARLRRWRTEREEGAVRV